MTVSNQGREDAAYQCVTIPADSRRGVLLIELNRGRFTIRVGNVSLFLSLNEAGQLIDVLKSLGVKR